MFWEVSSGWQMSLLGPALLQVWLPGVLVRGPTPSFLFPFPFSLPPFSTYPSARPTSSTLPLPSPLPLRFDSMVVDQRFGEAAGKGNCSGDSDEVAARAGFWDCGEGEVIGRSRNVW